MNFLIRLQEQAARREHAKSQILNHSPAVVSHLVKLLRYSDIVNRRKHTKDVNNWLLDVQFWEIKPRGKRLKSSDYVDLLLYSKYATTDNTVYIQAFGSLVNKLDKQYSGLKRRNTSLETLFKEVESILSTAADQISKNKFITIKLP